MILNVHSEKVELHNITNAALTCFYVDDIVVIAESHVLLKKGRVAFHKSGKNNTFVLLFNIISATDEARTAANTQPSVQLSDTVYVDDTVFSTDKMFMQEHGR